MMERNKFLLRPPSTFRSDRLDQRIDIVRQFTKSGAFRCSVLRNDHYEITFTLVVKDNEDSLQIEIDLSKLDFEKTTAKSVSVSKGGYVIFYSGWGEDTFGVRVFDADKSVMDTTGLSDGELIVVTPFSPGSYELMDQATEARLAVTVEPLGDENSTDKELALKHHNLMEEGAKQVRISEGRFEPNEVTLCADQPVVITAAEKTLIIGAAR